MRNLNTKLNAKGQNIAILTLRPPVSQLAKTHFPTLKTAPAKGFEVGSNSEKKAHTHSRSHTHVHTHEENDLKAMLHLNKLLVHLMPEIKVCYHNPLYVQQISENYSKEESSIFLQWVKTFALLRRSERTQPVENVILSDDNDFLSAFKLMKQRKIALYSTFNERCKNKVWSLLQYRFMYRTFTTQILARELFYNYTLLKKIITVLLLEHKIEFFQHFGEYQVYRIRENNPLKIITNND